MLEIDFKAITTSRSLEYFVNSQDWALWRDTYSGGTYYRTRYLKRFSDREEQADFDRRTFMTPIPAYAKREVNRVKNALFRRFPDIIRRGGSQWMQNAMTGEGAGVDAKGASVNSFLGKKVLSELLVMGKVGVLVDAPRFSGLSKAEVPQQFSPYWVTYGLENIHLLIPGDHGHPSDFKAVLLQEVVTTASVHRGAGQEYTRYLYYWIDEQTDRVHVQLLDHSAKPTQEVIKLDRNTIPFYLYDIGDSLLKDAAPHQVAVLNMASSDTSYVVDANFPFLTRQRGNANAGHHLKGEEKTVEKGVQKGLFYEARLERPQFIAPPTDPMRLSLEMRRELKTEIREMISGQVSDLGDDGSMDSGLSYIGLCLEEGEQKLWDLSASFEQRDPRRRQIPVVKYPDQWTIKSDKERIEEADALSQTTKNIPGRKVKDEINKMVAEILLRGKVKPQVLEEIKLEIEQAPYCTSDPEIVIPAVESALMSEETGALALGGRPGEAEKAKADRAERAAMITAAQMDAAAGADQGEPEGSVDPGPSARAERQAASNPENKLDGDRRPGVRGKGRFTQG